MNHPEPDPTQPTRFAKLSDVRNYFGISTNGLKLYEKEGLARLAREDEDGRRYCTLPAAVLLCNAMDYTSYGFTLRETAKILLDDTAGEQLDQLDRLNGRYLAQMEDLAARMRRLETERGALRAYVAEPLACTVRSDLDLYDLPIHSQQLVMGPGNDDANAWWAHAPFVTTGAIVTVGPDDKPAEMAHGPVASGQDVARLALPLRHAVHFCLLGRAYVRGFVAYPADKMPDEPSYAHIRAFMEANGIERRGDTVLHRLLRYWDEGDTPMRVDEAFVPVEDGRE